MTTGENMLLFVAGISMMISGAFLDRAYMIASHQVLRPPVGEVSDTYDAPGAITVQIYGTTGRERCAFFKGERGQQGWMGRGGDGATGMVCGDAIAILPGHGGRAR